MSSSAVYRSVPWVGFAALAAAVAGWLADQEARLDGEAAAAVDAAEVVQAAWHAWDRDSPPSEAMWAVLPRRPGPGVAGVRWVLAHGGGAAGLGVGLAGHPLLLRHWYRDIPVSELTEEEISLLAAGAVPPGRFGRAHLGSDLPTLLALDPALAAEVEARCAGGCPSLRGFDPEGVVRRLVPWLDDPGVREEVAPIVLLARMGPVAAPALGRRMGAGAPEQGRSGAFLALSRASSPSAARAVVRGALAHPAPGIRFLACLEAARLLDPSLLPAVRSVPDDPTFPGLGSARDLSEALLIAEAARRGAPGSPPTRRPPDLPRSGGGPSPGGERTTPPAPAG